MNAYNVLDITIEIKIFYFGFHLWRTSYFRNVKETEGFKSNIFLCHQSITF